MFIFLIKLICSLVLFYLFLLVFVLMVTFFGSMVQGYNRSWIHQDCSYKAYHSFTKGVQNVPLYGKIIGCKIAKGIKYER